MYQQVETDKEFFTPGGSQHVPVATLADEYGGRAQIAVDDHCYVLYLRDTSNGTFYKPTNHIFEEAFKVLRELPSPAKGA